MQDKRQLFEELYAAFNRRDIDGALRWMRDGVDWPKASEGGRVVGKEGIRAYWLRQWAEFDPHVEPVRVMDADAGTTEVEVHQVVKDLGGTVLADLVVWHVYRLVDGLIARMDVADPRGGARQDDASRSRAFRG